LVFLFDKDGKIIHAERGVRETFETDISKIIEQALK